MLRDAFEPDGAGRSGSQGDSGELVHRFYTHWFALDASVRDLFPPEMSAQRAAFGHAMHWVYGELVARRAREPVAFLAQLGRDHRKYGVLPHHYDTLGRALLATLRSHLGAAWTGAVDDAARQSLNLITGVMSGAADAEEDPPGGTAPSSNTCGCRGTWRSFGCSSTSRCTTTPGNTSTPMCRNARAAGGI